MELPDRQVCYRALKARDRRFDGRFFTAVRTTGIYCRPICPARTPRFENVVFYPSAAAAQEAGFRPCLRCRPEASPELALWRGTSNTVARALALIARGAFDEAGGSVERLAARVGVGERQLRRLFRQHLGASPIAVAQTRRVLFAKQLVQETDLPMIDVALAAGFGSLRRFNATFRSLYQRPPSELRRRKGRVADETTNAMHGVRLHLAYRPPYAWEAMLDHLAARAIPGVEHVEGGVYRRSIANSGDAGTITVANAPDRRALVVTIRFPEVRAFPDLVERVKRVFDVSADMDAIERELATDTVLAELVTRRPGLRVPGGWDGFELSVRAVLGQQVTVVAARALARHLVTLCGARLPHADVHLAALFPDPARVLGADLETLPMPRARRATVKALAEAAVSDATLFEPARSLEDAVARFKAIRGIGDWTAHYIALRALRETDAFPAADAGLLRAAGTLGLGSSERSLRLRADAWRPWRAYAAQHLWSMDVEQDRSASEVAYG